MAENMYLLLNEFDIPIGQGRLLNPPENPQLQVKLVEGEMDAIEERKKIKLVGLSLESPTLRGKVLRAAGDSFILGEIVSGANIRETLRVPVDFDSLIYPLDGGWTGRRKIQFVDLSGGGLSFTCQEPLACGECFEVVIPITMPAPVVLRAQVLRLKQQDKTTTYAAKFIDLCYDEERVVCEAVFAQQLRQHKQQKKRNTMERKGDLR